MTEHGSGTPEKPDASGKPARSAQPAKRRKRPRGNQRPPATGPASSRASRVEVEQRIGLVLSLIVQGVCRRRAIMQTVAKLYGEGRINWRVRESGEADPSGERVLVSPRMLDLYLQRATDELARIADEPRAIAKSKARARYELALAGAASAKEWDTVRKINRDLVRLDGLEPGARVNVSGGLDVNTSGTVEHTHTHRVAGSMEERASRITDIIAVAMQRRAAVSQPSTAQAAASEN